jgi:hypothetical protein
MEHPGWTIPISQRLPNNLWPKYWQDNTTIDFGQKSSFFNYPIVGTSLHFSVPK